MDNIKYSYVLQRLSKKNTIPTILEVFDQKPTYLELFIHVMIIGEPTNSGLEAIYELLNNCNDVLDGHNEPIPVYDNSITYYLSKHQINIKEDLYDSTFKKHS